MTPTQREAALRLAEAMQAGADDPMWAHHAEIKKSTLNYAAALLRELAAEPAQRCPCGDRAAAACPGEWEPGCDLGANEKHVRVAEPVHEPYGSVTTHKVSGQHFFYRWPDPPYLDTASECVTVYTHPPQRQPLTDEQIDDLAREMVKGGKSVNWLARAIERAHGIGEQK
jgi:hypothetical protein